MLNQAIVWVARHERVVVAAGLGLIVVLAWAFLFTGAGMSMPDMPDMRHAGFEGMAGFVIVFVMWAVMMVAMMLPSAAPTVLLFDALMRSRATSSTLPATGIFAGAYVVVWAAFSAVATIAHWALHQAGLVSPQMRSTSGVLAGLLLVAAGAYQMTPMKGACLQRCRSPIQFLTRYWRPGPAGALWVGLLHGGYCVGCCWALMGLLFVAGVMNLLWIGAIAALVLMEKLAFFGTRVGRIASGVSLMAAGAVVLVIAGVG
jgi:predicted metal-binding membrane protein